ncbi:hypothetical protein FGO68_gene12534 [Halteria grandinella]|uniref:GAF domain-containing protein n=1 Tax=Halteria grandinella TaxID=5974 RepID=A0A8J8SX97_HALGN|nr:hypothetical protein FGO68_gene12534 [Halteria grandinella]
MSERDSTLSQVDEQMLQIIMHFLQIKLDKLTTDQDYAVARKEVLDSIKLATMICTQRSFSELFDNMRQFIPKFFGFQSVGILLKDQQTNELFTFVDTYDNKVQKSEKSKEANYKNIDPVNDVVTMKIPNSMGITGLVYKTDETFVCQNAQKEQRYQADVDNLGGNTNSVNNFIIGSIYGYPEEKGKKKIVGILQLVNKLAVEDPITEYDKKKFKAFQSLIGMAVDNTAEIYTTINVTLAVKQAFEGLRKYLDNITVGHDENNKNSTHITEHFMQINNQIRKLQSLKRQPMK